VPASFTAAELSLLATASDPRLALAAGAAEDGRVIQFLAGAPELMARYRNAPPPAAALVSAAMDALRMGMAIGLPLAFLEGAASGYLTDTEWDELAEDWLERALAYTAAPCKGIRGPLARIRPRGTPDAALARGPAYRLADYLEQHGRTRRHIPPTAFWEAAARFACPADLPTLAAAAESHGLLRDAARLRKHALAQGDAWGAVTFVRNWHSLRPYSDDPRPAQWAASHSSLNDSYAAAELLHALREAGAGPQVAALADRAAAHASLDNPQTVVWLLGALRRADAGGQVAALAARAAAHAPLADSRAVAELLGALRRAGAAGQVAVLAARAAARAPVDNPAAAAKLLDALREAGAGPQVAALADRAAAHASLDDQETVDWLLCALRRAGAADQVAALAGRAVAHITLDNPAGVALLLGTLRRADAFGCGSSEGTSDLEFCLISG
jgi:hypothetical protein